MSNKAQVGHIDFINCLPLSYAWQKDTGGLEIVRNVPSYLNQAVTENRLDVSPVSSIIYARNSEKLLVLPDVSISADGALQSIMLVSRRPLNDLKQAKIALTAKSATSHCLLKIVMAQAYQAEPEYFITARSLADGVLEEAEAVLLIGDDALHAYHHRSGDLHYYDIGDEWKKMTGLMMVYALWVVNRDFASANPAETARIAALIKAGFAFGLRNLKVAAEEFSPSSDFTSEQLIEYIGLLNYQLTPQHQTALLTYYQLAYELKLIEYVPKIQFAQV